MFIYIKQPFFKRKQIVDGIPSFQINSFQAFYFFWNNRAPVISHQQDKWYQGGTNKKTNQKKIADIF